MAEAHARMLLKEEVEEEDAEAAINLMEHVLSTTAIDGYTGMRDIDVLMTGVSTSERMIMQKVTETIKRITKQKGEPPTIKEVIDEVATSTKVRVYKIREVIEEMIRTGELYMPSEDKLALSY